MKRLVDVEGDGLLSLLGQSVTIFAANYIYAGVLEGVNETCVRLSDAHIVYETGPLTGTEWKDAQALPEPWYVQASAIESFGAGK
jgi:hypothetical protein